VGVNLVLVDWDDIPEITRRFLQQKIDEGFPFDEGKYVLHGPEHFKPGYEARKIDALDYGDWQLSYDPSMYRHEECPGPPAKFGFGDGFHQVAEEFRPDEPVKMFFKGRKLKGRPKLHAFHISRSPPVVLVNAAVFEILQKVEPVAEDRVLRAEAYYRDEKVDGEFYIIDPPSVTDMIDLEASVLKWDKAGSGKWLARENHYGLAFKKIRDFISGEIS